MNKQLENLSPTKKREWFLQQLKNEEDINYAIRGQDLSGIDLSNINFKTLKIASPLLFKNCCLKGANFENSILKNIRFQGVNLDNANFSNAIFENVSFSYNTLQSANFSNAKINGVFWGANLSHANFEGATFCGANFNNANLSHANLYQAVFKRYGDPVLGIYLSGRNSFEEANLHEANLQETQFQLLTSFAKANLTGAKLSTNFFKEVEVNSINITKARLPDGSINEPPVKPNQESKNIIKSLNSLKPKIVNLFKFISIFIIWLSNVALLASIPSLIGYWLGGIGFIVAPFIILFLGLKLANKPDPHSSMQGCGIFLVSLILFVVTILIGLFLYWIGLTIGNVAFMSAIMWGLITVIMYHR